MGLNDEILDFEGRSPVSSYRSLDSWFFILIFWGSFREIRKPDFRLRTTNNEPKQKDES